MSQPTGTQPALPGAPPLATEVDLTAMVKANLDHLYCIKCSSRRIASDGSSNNRLRIACASCKKSFYASKLEGQLKALKALPTREGSQAPPATLHTDPHISISLTPSPFTNDSEDDAPLPCDGMSVDMEDTQDKLLDMIDILWQHREETTATMSRHEAALTGLQCLLSQINMTIGRLAASQEAMNRRNEQPPAASLPATNQSPTYGALPANHGQPQTPLSYIQAATTPAGGLETPWQLVEGRKRRSSPSPDTHARYIAMAEQSRYDALRQNIPSMDRSVATREHACNEPERTYTRQGAQADRGRVRKLTEEELSRVLQGKPASGSSPMCILYFRGLKRTKIQDVKSVLLTLGIRLGSIRNISFVGKSLVEFITFEDAREEIVRKLAARNITEDKYFDPLSTENIKDARKLTPDMTENEKKELAERFYRNRVEATLKRLPLDARQNRLRNFLSSRLDPTKRAKTPYVNLKEFVLTAAEDRVAKEGNMAGDEAWTEPMKPAIVRMEGMEAAENEPEPTVPQTPETIKTPTVEPILICPDSIPNIGTKRPFEGESDQEQQSSPQQP